MALLNAYRRSWNRVSNLPPKARSVHARLWLQLLSPNELIDLTASAYSGASGFDSDEHNSAGLWDWETSLVDQYFASCRTVLVAAAGAGREMIALTEKGFEVTGFDSSPDLVRAGADRLRARGISAPLLNAKPCAVSEGLGKFDGLIVGRGALHHIPGRQRRIGFLRACREHLAAGAPLLVFDVLTRPSKRVGKFGRHEHGDHVSSSFFHLFNAEEMEAELKAAEFKMLEFRPTVFPGGGSNLAQAAAVAV